MTKNMTDQGIVPIINTLQKIENHFAAFSRKKLTSAEVVPLLTEGWDFTRDRRKVDEPGDGMWRAPHLAIEKNIDLDCDGMSAIIAPGMSVIQLEAGLWRQLRVLPINEVWRRAAADHVTYADPDDTDLLNADPFDNDPFNPWANSYASKSQRDERTKLKAQIAAVDSMDRTRDDFFVTLIGHTPKDVSEFLVDLEKKDPEIARMLFAKNFKAAFNSNPACHQLPWPAACLLRFKAQGRKDYLPPVLALILLSELARHAQGQSAHIRLSFDKQGRRVGLKTVREDIPTAAGGNALAATKSFLRWKWLQTSAMLAPTSVIKSGNKAVRTWIEETEKEILDFAHQAGSAGTEVLNQALRAVFAPTTKAEVASAVCNFISHPNAWPINRRNGTLAFPNRPAITFHGLTWSESASVALLLVANQARSWSALFRSESIPTRRRDGRPCLAQSVAAVTYYWLETNAPLAFYGAYLSDEERKTFDASGALSFCADNFVESAEAGKDLYREAKQCIKHLRRPRERGFSALAHASLWVDHEHDDLHHYQALARKYLVHSSPVKLKEAGYKWHGAMPINLSMSASVRNQGSRRATGLGNKAQSFAKLSNKGKEKDSKMAAIVAQVEAMILGPTSTDPMHPYLLRSERKSSKMIKKEGGNLHLQ